MPKMHKQRQSVPKCLLWPAVVALLIRCTFVSEMRTECGGINSSSFTKHFLKCDFEIWLDLVHELLPHFENQNSFKGPRAWTSPLRTTS